MVDAVWMCGCAGGVITQLFHNSIMRVPLTRKPWMHVILGVAGGYALQYYDARVEEARVILVQRQKEAVEQNVRF
jgi:hypothetical protein